MGTMIVSLILAIFILAPIEAIAWDGEIIDNTITGCVKNGGSVRKLQRGDEPKRACGRKEQLVRFSETPLGHNDERPSNYLEVRVVSWDVELAFGEELAPTPDMKIVCKDDGGLTDLTIRINGKVVANASTETIGHTQYFVYQESAIDRQFEGGGFLIRAAGTGSSTISTDPLPCASEGFAEFFDAN